MKTVNMKYFAVILFMLPAVVFAQAKKDYELVMRKFVEFYNVNDVDSVCTLFPADKDCFWRIVESDGSSILEEYGKIASYKYLGKTEDVTVFKVEFSKKETKAMSFNLDKNNKFGTFRFDTSSAEIKKMLRRAK